MQVLLTIVNKKWKQQQQQYIILRKNSRSFVILIKSTTGILFLLCHPSCLLFPQYSDHTLQVEIALVDVLTFILLTMKRHISWVQTLHNIPHYRSMTSNHDWRSRYISTWIYLKVMSPVNDVGWLSYLWCIISVSKSAILSFGDISINVADYFPSVLPVSIIVSHPDRITILVAVAVMFTVVVV